jgi:hypothetical protein
MHITAEYTFVYCVGTDIIVSSQSRNELWVIQNCFKVASLPSGFLSKTLHAFIFSPVCATCPARFIVLGSITFLHGTRHVTPVYYAAGTLKWLAKSGLLIERTADRLNVPQTNWTYLRPIAPTADQLNVPQTNCTCCRPIPTFTTLSSIHLILYWPTILSFWR